MEAVYAAYSPEPEVVNMILAIIAAVVCLVCATMMYTPKMRMFSFYKPFALLFLFEGIWLILDYIFRQIFPDNVFMQVINYIGLILIGIYFIIDYLLTKKKPGNKK